MNVELDYVLVGLWLYVVLFLDITAQVKPNTRLSLYALCCIFIYMKDLWKRAGDSIFIK